MPARPEAAVVADDAAPATSLRSGALGLLVAAGVVAVGLRHRGVIEAGGRSLLGADPRWLLLALLAAAAVWVVGAAAQAGSVDVRLPRGQLLAVQVAASCANQLLPGGLGGLAVNLRFFRRQGLSRGASLGAVALGATVTVVTHVLLLVGFALAAPALLSRLADAAALPQVPGGAVLLLGVALAGGLAVLLGPARAGTAARLRGLGGELRRLARVARTPPRALPLWAGSAGGPLLHGLVLLAVLRSLAVPVSVTPVVVYLAGSALAALVPSPGAVGALDVVLVAGLTGAGLPVAAAVAGVVGYRLVTVWVPLVPSALVLLVLVRRRIV